MTKKFILLVAVMMMIAIGYGSTNRVAAVEIIDGDHYTLTYQNIGGLTYQHTTYDNQYEIKSVCSDPSLFVADVLEGKYLGFTSYYRQLGEFDNFIIGDKYYKYMGGVHYIYQIYDKCYLRETELYTVDMNGDSYLNGTYAAVMWEYDYSIAEDMAYLDDYYFNPVALLPVVTDQEHISYRYFKSLFLKFNPRLNAELMLIFSAYLVMAEEQRDESESQADSYLEELGGENLGPALKIFLKSALKMDNGGTIPTAAVVDAAYETLKEGLATASCNAVKAEMGDTAGEVCSMLVENGITNAEQLVSGASLGDIISDYAMRLASDIVKGVIKKALMTLGAGIYYAYCLAMSYIYQTSADEYQKVIDSIYAMQEAMAYGGVNYGRNIRMDYVISEYANIGIGSAYTFRNSIAAEYLGIVISFAKTDVVPSIIADSVEVPYNFGANYAVTPVYGTLTALTETAYKAELAAATMIYDEDTPLYPPAFHFDETYDYFFVNQVYGDDHYYPVTYTLDRNRYFTASTFANTPLTISSTVLKYETAARIYYSVSSNLASYRSCQIRLYRSGILMYTYTLTATSGSKYISGLLPGTLYTFEIWTTFASPFDGGTIQVKTYSYFFRTVTPIPDPIDPILEFQ